MGTFTVEIKVSNWQNRFLPENEKGEEVICEAVVDSGAVQLSLPAELIEKLKLVEVGKVRARTADGGLHLFRVMGVVEVSVNGRAAQVRVVELPRGAKPLLGAIPLEEMDLLISVQERKLIPNPESPEMPSVPLY
ncbi:hypothetical protein JXI42_11540 [bacterium]|nr:hypothetical protein [bacterium]